MAGIAKRNALLNGMLLLSFAALLAGIGVVLAVLPDGGSARVLGTTYVFPPGASFWRAVVLTVIVICLIEGGLWQIRTGRTIRRFKRQMPEPPPSLEPNTFRRTMDPIVAGVLLISAAAAGFFILLTLGNLLITGQVRITPAFAVLAIALTAYLALRWPLIRALRAGREDETGS